MVFHIGQERAGWRGLMAGVTLQLGRVSLIDLPTLILALLAAVLLVRYKINSAWLVR